MSIRVTTTGRRTCVVIPFRVLREVGNLYVLFDRQWPFLVSNRIVDRPRATKRRAKAPIIGECVECAAIFVSDSQV